jgi:hypothetical protein
VTADAPSPDENHTSDGRCKYPKSCAIEGRHAPSPDVETVLARVREAVFAIPMPDDADPAFWLKAIAAIDAVAAALRGAGLPEPSGVTVTEWGVRLATGEVRTGPRRGSLRNPGERLVTRQRTTYPDRVTDWQEATP